MTQFVTLQLTEDEFYTIRIDEIQLYAEKPNTIKLYLKTFKTTIKLVFYDRKYFDEAIEVLEQACKQS